MSRWKNDIAKVCTRLNANDLPANCPVMEACMCPRVLTLFRASLQTQAELAFNDALETARAADAAAGGTANVDQVNNNGLDHCRHVDHLETGLQEVLTS